MERRRLGRSDIEFSAVSLGAWAIGGWMWGGTGRKDSIGAIHACRDHGITSIDTAPIYGFGLSEEIVGEAVLGDRSSYEILTKGGLRWNGTRGVHHFSTRDNEGNEREVFKYAGKGSIISECEESLKRLGTDYIDLYQIHWPDDSTPIEETMEALELLLQQGKIRAAGVSNYSVQQMKRASEVIPLNSNQLPYSMVRREIEAEIIPWCLENHCSILAYSPLQRGLLTGKILPGYPFASGDSRPDLPHFRKNNLVIINQFLDTIKPIAEAKEITLSQLVICWTLQRPGITIALVGARNESQAKQNAGAAQVALTKAEMDQINTQIGLLKLDLE
jgi:aryl-alcohol dehydrogenase-like predicted oxidoreductase